MKRITSIGLGITAAAAGAISTYYLMSKDKQNKIVKMLEKGKNLQ